jgi:hypothetical protein
MRKGLGSSYRGLRDAKIVAREKYAWPGGYPLALIMSDGGVLCPDCVRKEWRNIVQYTFWNQPGSGWMAEGMSVEECPESDVSCDHCNAIIAEAPNA